MSGGKHTGDYQPEGGSKKIRGLIHPTIAQTLQLIFNKYSYKLKLSTLLQHASTNMTDLLGPDTQGICAKALLLGYYHTNCKKHYERSPSNALIQHISQKLAPGVQCYAETGLST